MNRPGGSSERRALIMARGDVETSGLEFGSVPDLALPATVRGPATVYQHYNASNLTQHTHLVSQSARS